jgi:hypothetical protein
VIKYRLKLGDLKSNHSYDGRNLCICVQNMTLFRTLILYARCTRTNLLNLDASLQHGSLHEHLLLA